MPCVSLKHRRIYREQILPCIKTRINTEKAAKSQKVNSQPIDNPQIINQNTIPSSIRQNSPVTTPAVSAAPIQPAEPTAVQTVTPRPYAAKPQLLVDGQEVSLRRPAPVSVQPTPALSALDQLNAELSNLAAPRPAAISSRNVSRSGGLRARLRPQVRPSREDLINAESRLGGSIFGPIPEGHRREFFHDQRNVWIWYEGWYEKSDYRQVTIRYEVYPSGVYKKISAGNYQRLENGELDNFRQAARTYLQLVKQNLYQSA